MKVINLDDEAVLIPIDKFKYRVSIRNESDLRQVVLIEPIPQPSKDREET